MGNSERFDKLLGNQRTGGNPKKKVKRLSKENHNKIGAGSTSCVGRHKGRVEGRIDIKELNTLEVERK